MESKIDLTGLVDTDRIVKVETIDPAALPDRRGYLLVKRIADVALSLTALTVLALPMALIALAVKLDSPGPVFYRQERLGKNGKPFQLVKFRSMRTDAEKTGAQWAKEHDTRVTRMGRIMRACRLDELPQFWGVVKGDLSLVGPRPERAVFYEAFEKYIPGFKQRLMVTPGITGLAQVNGGYDLKPAEKIQYDVEYIKHQSLGMDLSILLKTVAIVLLGTRGGGREGVEIRILSVIRRISDCCGAIGEGLLDALPISLCQTGDGYCGCGRRIGLAGGAHGADCGCY